jgi:hypothetical protein
VIKREKIRNISPNLGATKVGVWFKKIGPQKYGFGSNPN